MTRPASGASRSHHLRRRDAGVSPVIAEVMIILIVVTLAAGAYVWFSRLGEDPGDFERAGMHAERIGLPGSSSMAWIKLSLVHHEDKALPISSFLIHLSAPDGATLDHTTEDGIVCKARSAQTDGDGNSVCGAGLDVFDEPADTLWSTGQAYYVPCQGEGRHVLTVAIGDTVVLDAPMDCDGTA